MTDAEIVKSLESLLDKMRAYESLQASIGKSLVEDIISMYNRQKAEIERLKADKIIAERHEKDARELYKDVVIQLKTAKSEARKEFAERLKGIVNGDINRIYAMGGIGGAVAPLCKFKDDIDCLLEEMESE